MLRASSASGDWIRAVIAGNARHAGLAGDLLERILSPIASMALADGPMKVMPVASQAAIRSSRLGEEAVARMDRLRAGCERRLDDAVGPQIGIAAPAPGR